jgi:hypothetical protein
MVCGDSVGARNVRTLRRGKLMMSDVSKVIVITLWVLIIAASIIAAGYGL